MAPNTTKRFLLALFVCQAGSCAQAQTAIEQGQQEIRQGMQGARPLWSRDSFFNLPKAWGMAIEPDSAAFRAELLQRYGLFYDPAFANDGLPVGLTQSRAPLVALGQSPTGFTVSCQACHTSTLFGQVHDGISNIFFDYQRFYLDMQSASGDPKRPFFASNPERNSMVSYSNYMGRLGIFVRNPSFPVLNVSRLYAVFADPNADNAAVQALKPELPLRELVKPQPWVDYKYKMACHAGLYADGGYFGSPSATHYALHFTLDPSGMDFYAAVQRFDQVGPAYLSSLTSPSFPWSLEVARVAKGQGLYDSHCAGCHGSFAPGQDPTTFTLASYPGNLVDRSLVGTDTLRIDYRINYDDEVPDVVKAMYKKTGAYIAPPLVGIWARAPYFHNASVPTLLQVLDSKSRMKRYGLHPAPNAETNFDKGAVGWQTTDLSSLDADELQALKLRDPYLRIYNPDDHLGMSNAGHTFGDSLSSDERRDLLEFLKAI